jgi:hypothetical protein
MRGDLPEWEIEIAYWIDLCMNEINARAYVIISWMSGGDLRPLAAAIAQGPLDWVVADYLRQMIDDDRFKVAPGSPRRPELFARTIETALEYERRVGAGASSEVAFEEVAAELRLGVNTVRAAVTKWRKSVLHPASWARLDAATQTRRRQARSKTRAQNARSSRAKNPPI